MKKLLLSLITLLALFDANAGPVENMAANCVSVMDSGLCRVALDPRDYPNATIPIILPTGVRRIDTQLYLAIRALGFKKDGNGNWLMCQKVFDACADWDSDACLVIRSLWRQ